MFQVAGMSTGDREKKKRENSCIFMELTLWEWSGG